MSEILVNTIKKADGTGSITVPADTGTVLTTATTASSIPGYGNVAGADMWRMTADYAGTAGDTKIVSANIERVSESTFGLIGSGMSQSSGVFTFPTTGVWFVEFGCSAYNSGNTMRAIEALIETSSDGGSNFQADAGAYGGSAGTGSTNFGFVISKSIIDVTNTSNVKVRFVFRGYDNTATLSGSSSVTRTYFTFIRLGDT